MNLARAWSTLSVVEDLDISSDSGILHLVLDPARARHNGRPNSAISAGEESMVCGGCGGVLPIRMAFLHCVLSNVS